MKILTKKQIEKHNKILSEIQEAFRDSTYELEDMIKPFSKSQLCDMNGMPTYELLSIVGTQLAMIREFYKIFIV